MSSPVFGNRGPDRELADRCVLAYASERGRALIDRELYLPKERTTDRERCRAAGIGDEVEFATKQVLAQRMIERALDADIRCGWVAADALYGQDTKFRLWLESRGVAHVVAVPKNAMVVSMQLSTARVNRVVAGLDGTAWRRLSCGDGVRGPGGSDWAAVDIRPLRDPRYGHGLRARRSASDPSDIAYHVCFGPAGTSVEELVRVAGARWAIEECFQTAKNETGLDHYQGTRLYGPVSTYRLGDDHRGVSRCSANRREKRAPNAPAPSP